MSILLTVAHSEEHFEISQENFKKSLKNIVLCIFFKKSLCPCLTTDGMSWVFTVSVFYNAEWRRLGRRHVVDNTNHKMSERTVPRIYFTQWLVELNWLHISLN